MGRIRQGEFLIGEQDLLLGHIGGMPFYISAAQFKAWNQNPLQPSTQPAFELLIDAVPGRAGIFSLEGSEGMRFVNISGVCPKAEIA